MHIPVLMPIHFQPLLVMLLAARSIDSMTIVAGPNANEYGYSLTIKKGRSIARWTNRKCILNYECK